MKKPSDETVIALIGKDISQIQKDMSEAKVSINEIKNAKYVTQNEMQVAIGHAVEDVAKDVKQIKNVLWAVGSLILLTVMGAILKLVLKV